MAAFVAGLGTGGTLMGNARRFKEEDPDTLIVAAEPLQGENVQGLRSLEDGYIPPIIDLSLLDRKIFVSNRDAVIWTKKLQEEEGLFIGVSSGAIASIAARVAADLDEGNVVFVAPDDGWKYPQLRRLQQAARGARGRDRLSVVLVVGPCGHPDRRSMESSPSRLARTAGYVGLRVLLFVVLARNRFLQLAHPAAHGARRLRQALGAENEQGDHADHEQLQRADVHEAHRDQGYSPIR